MIRRIAIAAGASVAAVLGIVQLGSMAIYGDLAQPPAVPALLPAALGLVLCRPLASPQLPVVVRGAYAQALLHRSDSVRAAAIVAALPDGITAADLRGQLAELRSQPADALAAYARAGDFERAQRLIDVRVEARAYAQAAPLERRLVDALHGDGQANVRARALWRLGQITQLQAVADPEHAAGLQRDALDAYDEALALAPNEETYLLAAGQQALTIGNTSAARRYYERALEAVPDSADARAGLDRARP